MCILNLLHFPAHQFDTLSRLLPLIPPIQYSSLQFIAPSPFVQLFTTHHNYYAFKEIYHISLHHLHTSFMCVFVYIKVASLIQNPQTYKSLQIAFSAVGAGGYCCPTAGVNGPRPSFRYTWSSFWLATRFSQSCMQVLYMYMYMHVMVMSSAIIKNISSL